jgi:hypothetical protein
MGAFAEDEKLRRKSIGLLGKHLDRIYPNTGFYIVN